MATVVDDGPIVGGFFNTTCTTTNFTSFTSGNSIVAILHLSTAPTSGPTAQTDQGDSFVLDDGTTTIGGNRVYYFSAHAITSGPSNVVFSWGGNRNYAALAVECDPLDSTPVNVATPTTANSNTVTGPTISATAGSIIFSAMHTSFNVTRTGTNGTVPRPVAGYSTYAYKETSGGTDNLTMTISGAHTWEIGAIEYLEASGGGGPTPIPPRLHNIGRQHATIIAHRLGGLLQ